MEEMAIDDEDDELSDRLITQFFRDILLINYSVTGDDAKGSQSWGCWKTCGEIEVS